MLRNHCGLAWRLLVAFLFLFSFYTPLASGAPLSGLPPIRLGGYTPPTTPTGQTSFSLSGYVYNDATDQGVMLPTDQGISAELFLISSAGTVTGFTSGTGQYSFTGLTAGVSYSLEEMPLRPTNFYATADNVGYFKLSSGGTWTPVAPASNGASSSLTSISGIEFTPSLSGTYSAVNYNFGEAGLSVPVLGIPTKLTVGPAAVGPSASYSTTFAVAGTSNRFLAGTGGSLDLSASVLNIGAASSTPLNWTATFSPGVSLTPSSTAGQAPGSLAVLTGTVNGASLSAGTQNATLTISGRLGNNGKLTTSSASTVIDPVASRTIDSAIAGSLGRVMAGSTASTNLTITSSGAYLNNSNLTLSSTSAQLTDASGNAFSVSNSVPVLYNGTTTSNSGATTFAATFSSTASGVISGTAKVPANTGLFSGETFASGAPSVVPSTLNVQYSATVLQQRQLTAGPTINLPSGPGGLLAGALVPINYSVISNSDSSHVTSVYVAGSASSYDTIYGYQVGQVTVNQTPGTLVNSAGTTTVPVSVLLQSAGQYSATANLNVVTAENGGAGLAGEGTYNPVSVTYSANLVGYAATGGSSSSGVQSFGAPLSAPIAAGAKLATWSVDSNNNYNGTALQSQVYATGTSGSNSTALNSPNTSTLNAIEASGGSVTSANVNGTVGSLCNIYDSTTAGVASTVTMAWRGRNAVENGQLASSATEKLPLGSQWLASDVVDIEGVPASTTYAMEMTFDDGINMNLDKGTATVAGAYLAKLVTSPSTGVSTWTNAAATVGTVGSLVTPATQGVNGSLQDFLAQEYLTYGPGSSYNYSDSTVLADLAGSWGVSLPASEGGQGTSWAIVNSNGQFAVVPEPSTLALLGAGIVGLLVYRVRRKRQHKLAATSL